MLERGTVMKALRAVETTASARGKKKMAQEFFDLVRAQRGDCWPDLAKAFRKDYYGAFDEIVPRIFATDEPLVIYHAIEHMDLEQKKELEVVEGFIKDCDVDRHALTLLMLAEKKLPSLKRTLDRKLKELEELPAVRDD